MARIIGITGTHRAGKGTLAEYLVEKRGFKHYSVRKFLEDELALVEWEADRDNMVWLANALRYEHGADFIVRKLYEQAVNAGGDCIIESIRSVGEVFSLRRLPGFELWAVDADVLLRYQRALIEGTATDNKTLDEFIAEEQREMHSEDIYKQNIGRCMELADVKFINNGTPEELFKNVELELSRRSVSPEIEVS